VPEEDQGQGQQGNGETPPATGSPQPPSPPASPSGETPPEEGKPKVVPVAELATERKKRKEAEARLVKLEQAEQARADAQKTEAEKAADRANAALARAEQAERELRSERLASIIRRSAKAAGFRDEDDVLLAVNLDSVEWDDDGRPIPKSVDAAVKAVATAKPHWLHPEGEHGTGSKFGGAKKGSAEADANLLRQLFPALGPPRRTQT
jgi:multidrug efflux pump subunit AcrA (membrane-fusion protein)